MNSLSTRMNSSGGYSTYYTESSAGPVSYSQSLSVKPHVPQNVRVEVLVWTEVEDEELERPSLHPER